MKSLKKTLSLVLALCLVFSLMGVAGAADFKDDAKIQYNEAVDVMNSIGVINGIGHDTFAPTASVTRAEAAKMVAYAVLGADVAKNLPAATTKFTDVDATAFSWATGSINYLTSKGIINGTSATTFEPNGKITAFQLGKMLLCAAGYGVNGEFVGPNWAINVSVTANSTGIFKGTKAEKFINPATREEAALYCFNGITKVAKVSYSKLDGMYKAVKDVNNDDDVLTLAEIAYPKLKSNTAKKDSFGRPAIIWTNKGNEIGKYAATAKFTYTKNLDSAAGRKTISKDLKDCEFGEDKDVELVPWENGKKVDGITFEESVKYISSKSGNGTIVSVYTDEDDENLITAITVIKEDLAKVTFVNTAKKSVKFETVTENAVQETYEIDSDNPNYAAVKDLEEDDRVLITPVEVTANTYAVAKVAMPETETGFIGAVDNYNKKIYLGTTPYEMAAAKTEEVAKATVDTKNKATLWLDALGFVVDTDAEAEADTNFILALDSYSSLVDGKIVPMVKGVLTDGSIVDVAVSAKRVDNKTIESGELYAIINTDDDIYKLDEPTEATSAGAKNTYVALTETKAGNSSVINSYDKRLTDKIGAPCHNYYASNVKFIYANTTANTAAVKTGVQKVTNIPEGSFAVIEKKGNENVVTAVYLVNGVAATVDSDSLLFLPSETNIGTRAMYNETTKKYETFKVYAAYKNGALIDGGIATKSVSAPGYYSYAKSDDTGAYVLAPYTVTSGESAITAGVITDSYANKIITLTNKAGNTEIDVSSAKICDVRTKDEQVTDPITPTAKGLCRVANSDAQVTMIFNADTNEADVVYITSVGDGYDVSASTGVEFCTTKNGEYKDTLSNVTAGNTIYVKSTTEEFVTSSDYKLSTVTAPAKDGDKGVFSFTMPMLNVGGNKFVAKAGYAMATENKTANDDDATGIAVTITPNKAFVSEGEQVTYNVALTGTSKAGAKNDHFDFAFNNLTGASELKVSGTDANITESALKLTLDAESIATSGTYTISGTVAGAVTPTVTYTAED